MTDVRLNPWIPGCQPRITHTHFSVVSSWTQWLCPCHQSSCRQLKVFLPRPRAIHYITLCPYYNKVVPLKPILQSPTGACDQNESSRAQFTSHHWSTLPQLAFRSKSLMLNKTKTSALINAGCFKKIFCSQISPAKCHHSCKGEPCV